MNIQHVYLRAQIAKVPHPVFDSAVAGTVQDATSLRRTHWALRGFALLVAFGLLFVVTSLLSGSARGQADPVQTSAPEYPNWWQLVQTNYTKTLNALWSDGSNGFFAVGDNGIIRHTTRPPSDPDFGVGWQTMASNTTERLQVIWGADSTHVFAGGVNGTILFYNGSTWGKMDVQPIYHIYDLWGTSSSDVYAVGLMRNMNAPPRTRFQPPDQLSV